MKNILGLKNCYGCGVCVPACPIHIIELRLDNSGFMHPWINLPLKCIDCGICLKVCSYNNTLDNTHGSPILAFAGWSNDLRLRQKCSTGGIAFEISKALIGEGYKACGVLYNTKLARAEHFVADSVDEYISSIGSKYLQSYTIPGFSQFNKKDKYVVVGTPCQIDSLRRYIKLKNIEDNFVLIDFFCHGVPSMNMWRKYLKHITQTTGIRFTDVAWRNKASGWHDSWVMTFKDNKDSSHSYTSNLHMGDLFYNMFLLNNCLNKPCYSACQYKMTASAADIRVGDLWGVEYSNNNLGVNGILVFTNVGKDVLMRIPSIHLEEKSVDTVLQGQMSKAPRRDIIAKVDYWLLKSPMSLSTIVKTNKILSKILYPFYALRWKLLKK